MILCHVALRAAAGRTQSHNIGRSGTLKTGALRAAFGRTQSAGLGRSGRCVRPYQKYPMGGGQTPGQTPGRPWANPYTFWANPSDRSFLHATRTARNTRKLIWKSDQVIPL